MSADIIDLPRPSPELVTLASELAAGVDRFCNIPGDGPNAITAANDRIWAKIEAFAPRSIADVLAKCHAGGTYFGEGIPKGEDDCLYAADRILLQMITDLRGLERRLARVREPAS